jgi:hypothetical protein
LERNPLYVGLAPVGSFYRGYNDLEKTSDVDVLVLIDADEARKDIQAGGKLSEAGESLCKQFSEQMGHRFQIVGTYRISVNDFNADEIEPYTVTSFATLLNKVSGTRIGSYRKHAFDWLQTLEEGKRDEFLKMVSDVQRGFEEHSAAKYVFRLLDARFHNNNQEWHEAGYDIDDDVLTNAREGKRIYGADIVARHPRVQDEIQSYIDRRMEGWDTRLQSLMKNNY